MRTLHLFAGAGGGLLADLILGHRPVGYVEIDEDCQKVIAQRIRDGFLPDAPIFGDIRAFLSEGYAESYQGMVDIVAGGFPCQDISLANANGGGIDGERSGLWREMAEVIRQVRPKFAFVENSAALTIRGAGRVFGDLARMGFDAKWGVLSAHEAGSAQLRKRMFIVAHPFGLGRTVLGKNGQGRCSIFNPQDFGAWGELQNHLRIPVDVFFDNPMRGVVRNDDGLAEGMVRLKAIGNGQCPQQAAAAWLILSER